MAKFTKTRDRNPVVRAKPTGIVHRQWMALVQRTGRPRCVDELIVYTLLDVINEATCEIRDIRSVRGNDSAALDGNRGHV